jgi:hypothetical protein
MTMPASAETSTSHRHLPKQPELRIICEEHRDESEVADVIGEP